MLDSHVVEFCTLFIITTNNDDNDFKSCIAKPKLFCFVFLILILFHGLYIILLYVLFL